MLKDLNDNIQHKLIFCYLRGTHHFALFYNICAFNPDIDFYVHSNYISVDEYRKSDLYNLKNVYFVDNIAKFKYKLHLFGAFITTDAQATSPHSYSIKIISFFNKLNIPVIELQHGLFQLGLHYYDCPIKENFQDDSLPTRSLADHILTYYPIESYTNVTNIGYPPYDKLKKSYKGEYNLILSNLHWKTYSNEEKYHFYKIVLQFIEDQQDKMFIWKQHYGEMINPENQKMIKNLFALFPNAEKNILFYQHNEMLKKINVSTLIQKSDNIISTVSTTLLDCEMYNKPTFVYKCNSNDCLLKRLATNHLFTNYTELSNISKNKQPLKTRFLNRYDNDAFIQCINSLYKTTHLTSPEILQVMLEFDS